MPTFELPSAEETSLVINRKDQEPLKIDLVDLRSLMRECRRDVKNAGREEEYNTTLCTRLKEEYSLEISTATQVELLSRAVFEALEDLEKKSFPSQE